MKKNKRGISLTEMVIAVAIVLMVMAMIIIPVITAVRRSAEITQCAANQRTIGSAILMFAVDHDGDLPGFYSGGSLSSTGTQKSLPIQLIPPKADYLPDSTVFRCPQAMGRIYSENPTTKWVDWHSPVSGNQKDRSGYWHIYYSPNSVHSPERGEFGRNDNLKFAEPYRAIMYCYYHSTDNSLSSHEDGSVNVLKIDGSVHFYRVSDYDRKKGHRSNFGWEGE